MKRMILLHDSGGGDLQEEGTCSAYLKHTRRPVWLEQNKQWRETDSEKFRNVAEASSDRAL